MPSDPLNQPVRVRCGGCHGTGAVETFCGVWRDCRLCKGTGNVDGPVPSDVLAAFTDEQREALVQRIQARLVKRGCGCEHVHAEAYARAVVRDLCGVDRAA